MFPKEPWKNSLKEDGQKISLNMKTRILIILFASLILSGFQESFACSCAANPDYFEILANADTAFQGTVVKTEDDSGFQKVHFMIHSVQKGNLEEGYFVMTNVNLYIDENKHGMINSCDPGYRKENTYQVFGWGNTEQNPVGETNMCSTRIIGSATIVLDENEEFQEEHAVVENHTLFQSYSFNWIYLIIGISSIVAIVLVIYVIKRKRK